MFIQFKTMTNGCIELTSVRPDQIYAVHYISQRGSFGVDVVTSFKTIRLGTTDDETEALILYGDIERCVQSTEDYLEAYGAPAFQYLGCTD